MPRPEDVARREQEGGAKDAHEQEAAERVNQLHLFEMRVVSHEVMKPGEQQRRHRLQDQAKVAVAEAGGLRQKHDGEC